MIRKLFYRVFGISLILIYIYIRFVYERLPRGLFFLHIKDNFYEIDFFLMFLTIIFFLISLFFAYFYMKHLLKLPVKIYNTFIIKYLTKFALVIKNSLFAIHELIADNINNSYEKLKKLVKIFYNKLGHKELFLILFFTCFPYVIIIISFLWDVFINFRLYYFYKSLFLLVIPLLFNIWLYFIEDLIGNMEDIENIFLIEHKFLENGEDHFKFVARSENQPMSKDVADYYIKEYLDLVPFSGFLKSYRKLENYYKPRVLFLMYFAYVSGWLFILYKNFMLII